MTYQPVISGPGLVGWQFLQRTYDAQFAAFSRSPIVERDSEYFLDRIAEINSASDLVKDRRLLGIALGAFGLQDDIDNRYFIQRILEDGTNSEDALATRLSDNRYRKLSEAFGFGPGETVATGDTERMAALVMQNRLQSFEVAVGEVDETMRIAMYGERAIEELANSESEDKVKWLRILGQPPLRTLFETALGLPGGFGQVDIDKQAEILRDRTRATIGEDVVSQFAKPEARNKLVSLFLARSQIAAAGNAASTNAIALQLLQSAGRV